MLTQQSRPRAAVRGGFVPDWALALTVLLCLLAGLLIGGAGGYLTGYNDRSEEIRQALLAALRDPGQEAPSTRALSSFGSRIGFR